MLAIIEQYSYIASMVFGKEVTPIDELSYEDYDKDIDKMIPFSELEPGHLYIARLVTDPLILRRYAADYRVRINIEEDPSMEYLKKLGFAAVSLQAVDLDLRPILQVPPQKFDIDDDGQLTKPGGFQLRESLFSTLRSRRPEVVLPLNDCGYIIEDYNEFDWEPALDIPKTLSLA